MNTELVPDLLNIVHDEELNEIRLEFDEFSIAITRTEAQVMAFALIQVAGGAPTAAHILGETFRRQITSEGV